MWPFIPKWYLTRQRPSGEDIDRWNTRQQMREMDVSPSSGHRHTSYFGTARSSPWGLFLKGSSTVSREKRRKHATVCGWVGPRTDVAQQKDACLLLLLDWLCYDKFKRKILHLSFNFPSCFRLIPVSYILLFNKHSMEASLPNVRHFMQKGMIKKVLL